MILNLFDVRSSFENSIAAVDPWFKIRGINPPPPQGFPQHLPKYKVFYCQALDGMYVYRKPLTTSNKQVLKLQMFFLQITAWSGFRMIAFKCITCGNPASKQTKNVIPRDNNADFTGINHPMLCHGCFNITACSITMVAAMKIETRTFLHHTFQNFRL